MATSTSTPSPLTESRRELAARYMPLAGAMARRAARSHPMGADDFRSAAFLALVEAARAFDESRGVNFATFARHRIRGSLIDARRDLLSGGLRGEPTFSPRFEPIVPGSEVSGCFFGATADDPVGSELETDESVAYCLDRLPPRRAAALRRIYWDGKTQREAAALDGCSEPTMSRIHRDGLERLAEMRERLLAG